MLADGGNEGLVAGHCPAFQVRHLVDRQLFLATAVAVEDALDAALGMPEVDLAHAVLAEQAGNVVAAIGGQQTVVGLLADVVETGDPRRVALAEVQQPGLVSVEQAVDEAPPWRVEHADHPRVATASAAA